MTRIAPEARRRLRHVQSHELATIENVSMFRKLLATVMTAAVFSAALVFFSVVLPGCGGGDNRPATEVAVPSDEEKASGSLRADPSEK